MKTTELVIGVASAVIAYFIIQTIQRRSAAPAGANVIQNASLPGEAAWGWQYFTDGTVIGPDGVYYKNGVQVWTPQR